MCFRQGKDQMNRKYPILTALAALAWAGLVLNVSAEKKTHAEQTKPLPRVLLIGDSICGGYQQGVKRLLAGKAVVVRQNGNAEHTGTGVKRLDPWLGDGNWDVIHFNWGLWDLAYRNPKSTNFGHLDKVDGKLTTSLADYEKNLRTLVARLKKTGAVLVWASTTPVPDGEPGRIQGDAVRYNAVAATIMADGGIAIDDLYAEVLRQGRPKSNNVHDTGDLSRKVAGSILAALASRGTAATQDKKSVSRSARSGKQLLPDTAEVFTFENHTAFVCLPEETTPGKRIPWLWYFPTERNLPGKLEKWMLEKCLDKGIAVAGIDLGAPLGNPESRASLTAFYKELTEERGLTNRACLLGRSRGGLQMYNWAVEHPESVACIAGIYPVCNMASWPGLKNACRAYGVKEEELAKRLKEHNPIDRLAPLAKAKVPIRHIHGDMDTLVPLEKNSALLAERYAALGGTMTLDVRKGQGHNYWRGFFESEAMAQFIIRNARRAADAGR